VSVENKIATQTISLSTDDIFLKGEKCFTPFDDFSKLFLDGSLYFLESDSIEAIVNNSMTAVFTTTTNPTFSYSMGGFFSSPDYTKAAFSEIDAKDGQYYMKVYILHKGVIELIDNPVFDNMVLIDWFDNDRLIFSPRDKQDVTIYLYNISTNTSEEISFPYSDLYPLNQLNWSWYGGKSPLPIYNQQLTYVLYLSSYNSGLGFAIRNIKSGDKIWEDYVSDPGTKPEWSSNGKFVYIVTQKEAEVNQEIFSIDITGHKKQLTDLSSIYSQTGISGIYPSPDGTYIAFWLYTKNDEEEKYLHLAVLDLNKNNVTEYCYNKGGGPIFWSPNGKQLAFVINDYLGGELHTIVFDLINNSALNISNNQTPIGWLVNP
jgi:Tol biopolymer transport system component